MFCTKCGKELYEGDKFCAFCGAEVRNHTASRNDEVVFNPPFKIEAQRKTEEILKATEERKQEEKAKRETVAFDWNLDGFPSERPKKTEDIDFNWDSVLEKRNRYTPEPTQPAEPMWLKREEHVKPAESAEPVTPVAPTVEKITLYDPEPVVELPREEKIEEDVMSVEELEKELFGGLEYKPDDRFQTFNQKNSEFQQLLDKEKERVQSLEEEYNKQLAEMDYTWVPEVFKAKQKLEQAQKQEPFIPEPVRPVQPAEPETPAKPEVAAKLEMPIEPETPEELEVGAERENSAQTEEPVLIGVVQPVTPHTVDLTEAAPSEKEKLRYSDIFPRVDAQGNNNGGVGMLFDEDDDEEEPVKKHTLLKVIITLLVIALVAEGAILAIKFIAPESKASQMINNAIFKVADLFTGKETPQNSDVQQTEVKDVYLSNIVTEKSVDVKSIGSVIYNPELVYDNSKIYSFEEISSADEFVDAEWQGMSATYGEKLLETIINHYDGWIETNKDKSLVGINTLEIGEIKTGQTGFYTLCRVTYAGADGSEITDVQTVYTVISNELMVINEIKEETL